MMCTCVTVRLSHVRFSLLLQEAQSRATEMKDRDNESFRKEDYYDALWKYEHAHLLCSNYSSLRTDIAVIHSNVAAACLKLGDTERRDLLDPQQYSPSYFQPIYVLWYAFANHHASKAIKLGSEPKIKQKVNKLLKMEIDLKHKISSSITVNNGVRYHYVYPVPPT